MDGYDKIRGSLGELQPKLTYEEYQFLFNQGYLLDSSDLEEMVELTELISSARATFTRPFASPKFAQGSNSEVRDRAIALLACNMASKDDDVIAMRREIETFPITADQAKSWFENIGLKSDIDPYLQEQESGSLAVKYIDWQDVLILEYKIPNALADGISQLASRLMARYQFTWHYEVVAWIIGDEIPTVHSCTFQLIPRSKYACLGRISMTLDPTMTPKQVAQCFASAKKKFFNGRHRNVSERNLATFAFHVSEGQFLPPKDAIKKLRESGGPSFNSTSSYGRAVRYTLERLTRFEQT
ncbi:MAG: hypothetical protein JST51_04850 [Armatimonadetes bacterium]|nr:hypothetical protein [Armatimonadota bacterium]